MGLSKLKSRLGSTSFSTAAQRKTQTPGSRSSKQTHHQEVIPTAFNPYATLAVEQDDKSIEHGEGDDETDLDNLQADLDAMKINMGRSTVPQSLPNLSNFDRRTRPEAIKEEDGEEENATDRQWETVEHKSKPTESKQTFGPVHRSRQSALQVSNWRNGNGLAAHNASGYERPRTAAAHGRRTVNRSTYAGGNIYFGIGVDKLCEGLLIFHMDTRECYDPNVDPTKIDVFKSGDGQAHVRKGRLWCIISVHAYCYTENPMYTYGGKGIMQKSDRVKKEHVGIRPQHVPSDKYAKQNEYPPLEVETMDDASEKLHEMSVLHFVQNRSTDFDTKLRIVGRLTGASILRLRRLRAQADGRALGA